MQFLWLHGFTAHVCAADLRRPAQEIDLNECVAVMTLLLIFSSQLCVLQISHEGSGCKHLHAA